MNFFSEKKQLLVVISLILLVVLLISSAMFVFFPTVAHNAFSYITSPIQKSVSNVSEFVNNSSTDLVAENEALKTQVEQLLLENSRVNHLDEDNKELTELLGTKQKFSQYSTITGRKIGQDFNNWNNTFIIDVGSNDGVKVDMIVIAQGALVGKVVSTTPSTSNVTTILDDSSSVSVVSTRSNDIAFVNGDVGLVGTNTCELEYLDASTPIFINDELFTSSISSLYPPGLSVGYVSDISIDKNNERSAIVAPIVDFNNLHTVLVINEVFTNTTKPGGSAGTKDEITTDKTVGETESSTESSPATSN